MYEMDIDMVKMGAVWERVTSDVPPPEPPLGGTYNGTVLPPVAEPPAAYIPPMPEAAAGQDETARLERFMDSSALCACYCRSLAARCGGGRVGKALAGIAENERRHLKKLRAKYFILTGGAYCPAEECPRVCTLSEGLREIYRTAVRTAEGYCAAADTAQTDLANTYGEFACDELRHADTVSGLIESMMC